MNPNDPPLSTSSKASDVLPSYQTTTTTSMNDDDDVEENHSNVNNNVVDENCCVHHNSNHTLLLERLYRAFSINDQQESSSSSPEEMQKLSPTTTSNDDVNQYKYHHRNKNNRFSFLRGKTAVSTLLAMGVAVLMLLISVHYYHKKHEPVTPATCPADINNNNDSSYWNTAFANQASLTGLKSAAVASDHATCSQMGLDIIKLKHGNAIDAAVTVALCLGIANPASSGMGGGAFILVHAHHQHFTLKQQQVENNNLPPFHDARSMKDQQDEKQLDDKAKMKMMTEVVDCREVAPNAATQDMYLHHATIDSELGGLAIGVPGELRGLELMHTRHGKLSWHDVVEPVAILAEHGVVVNANLANEISIIQKHYISNTTNTTAEAFAEPLRHVLTHNNDWNRPLQQGDLLQNFALAKTLRNIQIHGANAIYQGQAAAQWAADIQAAGGIVTTLDLETYQATLRSPVIGHGNDMQGLTVVGVPPPSSGGAAIIGATRFLASFQMNSANNAPLSRRITTLTQHRMVEATKHAFAIRMSMSDPDIQYNNTATVQDAVKDLVHSNYMQTLQRNVHNDSSTLPLSHYGGSKWAQLKDTDGQAPIVSGDAKEGDRRRRRRRLSDQNVNDNDLDGEERIRGGRKFGNLNDGGTSHFSILDQDGNAVSMTTSINTYFGSNVLSPSTGILLSNTMDDFSNPGRPNFFGLQPSAANYIHAGKKPLSSMSPTLVFAKNEEQNDDNDNDDNDDWGDLVLVLGASGGPKIISAVFRVLVNHLFLGMDLWQAIVDPRLHDQLIYHGATVTTYEKSTVNVNSDGDETADTTRMLVHNITAGNRTLQALQNRGHGLVEVDYEGTVQAISVDMETKELTAVCDVRKGGAPAGY